MLADKCPQATNYCVLFECENELKFNKLEVWARLASLSHLCLISDPLMVSKFQNGIHGSKCKDNEINITLLKKDRDVIRLK